MRNISLDSTHNTRDLGYLKTKNGERLKKKKVLRSGSLMFLTEKDMATLKRYHLEVVIDFRSEREFERKADKRIQGVRYINLPALPKKEHVNSKDQRSDSNLLELVNKDTGGFRMLMETYEKLIIAPEGIKAYQDFFNILEEDHKGSILFHCSQGKDRTGLGAFFFEYALGVSKEDCYKDYLYTNKAMKLKIEELSPVVIKESQGDYSLLPILKDVFMAKVEYLDYALKTIDDHFGSFDNYLIHILHVDINRLKEIYLDS